MDVFAQQILLDASGIDVNAASKKSRTTALHLAAALGNDQIVGLLLKKQGDAYQGCQMVCFQTKNSNLGKIFRASDLISLVTSSFARCYVIFSKSKFQN
jgi:ankyrin repeat protein